MDEKVTDVISIGATTLASAAIAGGSRKEIAFASTAYAHASA